MRPRAPRADAGDADRETVLYIYTVEILYAAVVDGHIDWHKATVETVFRASLSDDQAVHFHGHERCVSARQPALHARVSPGPGLVLRMALLHAVADSVSRPYSDVRTPVRGVPTNRWPSSRP